MVIVNRYMNVRHVEKYNELGTLNHERSKLEVRVVLEHKIQDQGVKVLKKHFLVMIGVNLPTVVGIKNEV